MIYAWGLCFLAGSWQAGREGDQRERRERWERWESRKPGAEFGGSLSHFLSQRLSLEP